MINKILIIEDIKAVLSWLKQAVGIAYEKAEITCCSNLKDSLDTVKKLDFDLALVDIGLPDGSGLEVVDYLTSHKNTLIVMTTIFDDDQHVFSALRKGAKGYILKDQDQENLAQMLINIENGQLPISVPIANKLLNFFNPKPVENSLTSRERDVLSLIAKGVKVPEVSRLLGIKSSTCYGYVKQI